MSNISTRCAAKTMLSWLQRVESEHWHVPSTSHSSRNVQTKQWNAKISKRIPRPPRVPSGPCATDAHKRCTRTRRFARDVGASSLRAASASVVDHGAVGVRWPERDRSWQITDKTTRRRCESASTQIREAIGPSTSRNARADENAGGSSTTGRWRTHTRSANDPTRRKPVRRLRSAGLPSFSSAGDS